MSYPNLHLLLQAANRRALLVGLVRAVLVGFSLFLAGLLVALIVDAVFAFASWGLIAVDLVLLVLCLALLSRAVGVTWRNRFDARRVARLLEHRLGIWDNSLINAVELRGNDRTNVSRRLVREAVERGEVCARDVAVHKAIATRPATRAALGAAGACALIVLAYVCAPSVFGRGIVRLLDPTGDHPPFTLVGFDISVSPETIYHGTPASVTASLSGPDLPERADIVFVEGEDRQRVPMYSSGPNAYLLTLERVERSRDFFIDTPKGRSKTYRLAVTMVPRVEAAEVAYRYPTYTDWSEERHSLVGRDIRAIVGTEVEIEVSSNLPLSHGTLELFESSEQAQTVFETVSLLPDARNPAVARGSFSLSRSGQARLLLTGENRATNPDPFETRIVAVPDRKPRIEITEPDPVVVAVENWKIPVFVQAIDDVELSRVELSMAINGLGVSPIELPDEIAERRQAEGRYEFDLEALGARPGDIITYYATAHDNHPGGEHFVDTDTYLIQVISHEEYLEYTRRAYRMEQLREELSELQNELNELQDQREQILQQLDQLQRKMEQGTSLATEDQQLMQQLLEQLQQFAEQNQELAQKMQERLEQPQLYDMEQSFRDMLKSMSQQLGQQADTASKLQQAVSASSSSSPSPADQQALEQALEEFRRRNQPFDADQQQQLEQNQQQAEAFQKADQIQSQAERIRSVIQQQRAIADRLQPLQNSSQLTPDQQQRANRLAREQELLRQELEEALSALEQAAQQGSEQLPKTAGEAAKLCQGMRQAGIMGDQDQAAQSARGGQARDAHEAAEQAARKLESFLSQCNGTQSGAAGDLDGGLSLPRESIENSLNQLAQGRSLPGLRPGKQGQSGRGMSGSMSRFSLHGPSMPMTGQSEARRGRMTARQSQGGHRGSDVADGAQAAESITVDSRLRSATGAGNLRGVPVGYRDQAEAYFRRLSEDAP